MDDGMQDSPLLEVLEALTHANASAAKLRAEADERAKNLESTWTDSDLIRYAKIHGYIDGLLADYEALTLVPDPTAVSAG